MADTPPPVPVYRTLSPSQVRTRRLVELGIFCVLAVLAAFYAARQLTGHTTVVVDKPSSWFQALKKG